MDKLILRKPKAKGNAWKSCNIDSETHETLQRLNRETGLTIAYIISEMVAYGVEHLEILED